MSEAWIETYCGLRFDTLDPQPEMIDIRDIAHALSQLCRFTGHTKFPYSVGQHSIHCSYLTPVEDALWALMHDASEAYIGDMNRPLKHFSEAGKHYQKVEERIMTAICNKFGLSVVEPKSVTVADNQMVYAEKRDLMSGKVVWSQDWGKGAGVFLENAANVWIFKMDATEVETTFLNRFHYFTGGIWAF
jgi:hypothetical protein